MKIQDVRKMYEMVLILFFFNVIMLIHSIKHVLVTTFLFLARYKFNSAQCWLCESWHLYALSLIIGIFLGGARRPSLSSLSRWGPAPGMERWLIQSLPEVAEKRPHRSAVKNPWTFLALWPCPYFLQHSISKCRDFLCSWFKSNRFRL